MFEVIEALSIAKSGEDGLNEDAYVITDQVVAVFDGATDKSGANAPAPGRRMAQALRRAAGEWDADTQAAELLGCLNAVARDVGEGEAVGALLHAPSRTLLRVGDVSVGIDGVVDVPTKLLDAELSRERAELLIAALDRGASVDELRENDLGRAAIVDRLREQSRWCNDPTHRYGYAAFCGAKPVPDAMTEWFDVADAEEIVLASDGYVCPQSTLEASEKLLAELVAHDPLRIEPPPGTKGVMPGNVSFDDRTYVRVRLVP